MSSLRLGRPVVAVTAVGDPVVLQLRHVLKVLASLLLDQALRATCAAGTITATAAAVSPIHRRLFPLSLGLGRTFLRGASRMGFGPS